MMRSPGAVCVACVIACFALADGQRLTEKPIDLLPVAESGLQGAQEPRHISGYFQVPKGQASLATLVDTQRFDLSCPCSSTGHMTRTCFTFSLSHEA